MRKLNVICPLCGKNTPETIFNPEAMDDDVYGVDVTGKGRGKGFAFSEWYSILNPEHPVIDSIRSRIRALSELLDVDIDDEKDRLIEELTGEAVKLTAHVAELQEEIDVLEGEAEEDEVLMGDLAEELTS